MSTETTSSVKQLSYLQRRQQSQEDKDQQELQSQVGLEELQFRADVLTTQASVAKAKVALEGAKSATPLSSQDIITAQLLLENAEDGLERLLALQQELFPA